MVEFDGEVNRRNPGSFAATASPRLTSRLLMTTRAPDSASAAARDLPSHPVAPVMRATFPEISRSSLTVGSGFFRRVGH